MASFLVKEWQRLSLLKMLIVQTMQSRSFGGKMKNAYCSLWDGVVGFSSCSHRTCCLCYDATPNEGDSPSPASFYSLQYTIKKAYLILQLTTRGRCFSMLTSSRHGLRPSFSLNKFYILIINLTVITKRTSLAKSAKICQLQVFSLNPTSWPQTSH
jgi:hypothetical protein